jgi:hypothetical protein
MVPMTITDATEIKRQTMIWLRLTSNQGILNTKVESITVPLTSCLTGFYVLQIKTKIVSCHTADSKPVKQYSYTSPFSIPWSND